MEKKSTKVYLLAVSFTLILTVISLITFYKINKNSKAQLAINTSLTPTPVVFKNETSPSPTLVLSITPTHTPTQTPSPTPTLTPTLTPTPLPKVFSKNPNIIGNINIGDEYITKVLVKNDKLYSLASEFPSKVRIFGIKEKNNPIPIQTIILDSSTLYKPEVDEVKNYLYIPLLHENISVYNLASGQKVSDIGISAYGVKIIPESRLLLAKGQDGKIYAVNLDDNSKVSSYQITGDIGTCSLDGYIDTIDILNHEYFSLNRTRGFCGSNTSYNDNNWLFKVYLKDGYPKIEYVKEMIPEASGEIVALGNIGYKGELSLFDNTRSVLSIADPNNISRIKVLKTVENSLGSMKIGVWNNELLVTIDNDKFDFYNISQKDNPRLLLEGYEFDTSLSNYTSVLSNASASGGDGYVYFANARNGISIIHYELK